MFFRTIKLPSACDSETAGKSIIAIEPVNALGKRINGSAIPFNMPYTLNAEAESIPYAFKAFGISVASKLASRLTQMRLIVKGVAKDVISLKDVKMREGKKIYFFLGRNEKHVIVKSREHNSPKTRPITAIAGDISIPFVRYK